MFNLFLDDVREVEDVTWVKLPKVEWTIVRNYDDFVKAINKNGLPDLVSFDHDLGAEHYPQTAEDLCKPIDYSKYKEKTGYTCATFLVSYCLDNNLNLPKYLIHSMNPVGAENISSLLKSFEKYAKNKVAGQP
jgi:3-mercaptopyruvate sulfurtransferase SseA